MEAEYIRNRTEKKMHKWQVVVLYLFPILSFYGYQYIELDLTLIKGIYFISIPLIAVYVSDVLLLKHKSNPYFRIMILITLSTALSIVMAYLFSDQSLLLGYRTTSPFLAIIFYFFLFKVRPTLKHIEIFVWTFAVIYIILWLYGISMAPTIIFGDIEHSMDFSRGIFRLSLPGRANLVLAFFLALNKYSYTQNKKFIAVSIFLFAFIVLQVTRQIIFWSLLVGFYYLLRNDKKIWFYVVLLSFSLIFVNNINIPKDSVVGELLAITENQIDNQKSGEDDIRLREYKFFFNDFSKNIITDIFGNGMPHHDSKYGNYYVNTVQGSYRFYLSDVGYAQMFAITGWIGLLLYLMLFWKVVRQNVSPVVFFAKLFIIYQIFANLAASWYTHDVICICICIYLLSMNCENKTLKT